MHIFNSRPLAAGCILSAVLALLSVSCRGDLKRILFIVFFLGAVFIGILSLIQRRCGAVRSVALICLITSSFSLASSYLFYQSSVEHFESFQDEDCTVEGYVLERLSSVPYESKFAVRITALNGEKRRDTVMLECSYPSALQSGDGFRITGTVRLPKTEAGWKESVSLHREGLCGILRCEDYRNCRIDPQSHLSWDVRMKQLNFHLSAVLKEALKGQNGALSAALLTGDRSSLSGETVLDFRRAGVSHLLAISGLHVSILVGLFDWLFKKMFIPKQARGVLMTVLAVLYLNVTGFSMSTVRAVLMVSIVYLALLSSKDYDAITSLAVALFVIVCLFPYAVEDLSLWLSFAAALGIIVFVPAVKDFNEQLEWLENVPNWVANLFRGVTVTLATGLFANAVVLLLSAGFFGAASVFSVPVTLLLSPLLSLSLIASILTLIFPHATPILMAARICNQGLLQSAHKISEIPYGTVLLSGTVTKICLILLALSVGICAVCYIEKRIWMVLPVLLSAAVLISGFADVLPKRLGTAVTYVRHKDSEAIICTEGRTAVVFDCSNGSATYGAALAEGVYSAKCSEIQELVLTHYHSKMTYLLSELSAKIKIRSIRLPTPNTENELAFSKRIRQEAELHGIRVLSDGEPLPLPSVKMDCLWRTIPKTTLEAPLVLTVTVGKERITYVGSGLEEADFRNYAIPELRRATTVIVGRHGLSDKAFSDGLPIQIPALRVIVGAESVHYPVSFPKAEPIQSPERLRFFAQEAPTASADPPKTAEPPDYGNLLWNRTGERTDGFVCE